MAAVHFLRKLRDFDPATNSHAQFEAVIHAATPGGNNSAGHTWKSVLVAAGLNTTKLTTGTGPGQISTAEKATLDAGDIIEIEYTIERNEAGQIVGPDGLTGAAAISAVVDARLAELARVYAQYGRTAG